MSWREMSLFRSFFDEAKDTEKVMQCNAVPHPSVPSILYPYIVVCNYSFTEVEGESKLTASAGSILVSLRFVDKIVQAVRKMAGVCTAAGRGQLSLLQHVSVHPRTVDHVLNAFSRVRLLVIADSILPLNRMGIVVRCRAPFNFFGSVCPSITEIAKKSLRSLLGWSKNAFFPSYNCSRDD